MGTFLVNFYLYFFTLPSATPYILLSCGDTHPIPPACLKFYPVSKYRRNHQCNPKCWSVSLNSVPSHSAPASVSLCAALLPPQAVGLGLSYIKLGGLSGAERMTKYNRLISIEEELARQGMLGGFLHTSLILYLTGQRKIGQTKQEKEREENA